MTYSSFYRMNNKLNYIYKTKATHEIRKQFSNIWRNEPGTDYVYERVNVSFWISFSSHTYNVF